MLIKTLHLFDPFNIQQLIGGYQLKVGGVVVGSWAGGVPNRNSGNGVQARMNRAAIAAAASGGAVASQLMRYPINARTRMPLNTRMQRSTGAHVASFGRTISRNTYGNSKVNRQRNRNRNRKNGKHLNQAAKQSNIAYGKIMILK